MLHTSIRSLAKVATIAEGSGSQQALLLDFCLCFSQPPLRAARAGTARAFNFLHEQTRGPEISHSRQGAYRSLVMQAGFTCRGFFEGPQPVFEQGDGAFREMLVAKLAQRIHTGTAALKLTAGWALQRRSTSWILLSEPFWTFFFGHLNAVTAWRLEL